MAYQVAAGVVAAGVVAAGVAAAVVVAAAGVVGLSVVEGVGVLMGAAVVLWLAGWQMNAANLCKTQTRV